MPERRIFQRFDIMTVVEFNIQTVIAGSFAGITRNFSYEGLCIETQCVNLEPGDTLEVRLRHPHSDVKVSVPAYVVWKKAADKFAYLMGIKLKETELDTRLTILEIMSAAGELPVDSFLSEGNENTAATAPAPDINPPETDAPVPEAAETDDEHIEPQDFRDEGLLSTEKDLITGKTSGDTFNEIFRAAQTEEPEAEDMTEEDVESDMPWPRLKEEADKAPYGMNHVLKQLLGNRTFMYSSIAAVIIGISVYALFLMFQRTGSDMKSPAPVPAPISAPSAIPEAELRSNFVPPVQDTGQDKKTAAVIQRPDIQPVSKQPRSKRIQREAPAVPPKPRDIKAADDQTWYIQVGAWKEPGNAQEMLKKLKKYYPEAYLSAGKKFNRIKIPVRNQAQVKSVIKDIEDKFHIKPLVTSVR